MKLDNTFSHLDVNITKTADFLTIENSGIKRILDISQAMPRTISLINKKSGKGIANGDKTDTDFSFIGFNMPAGQETVDFSLESIDAKVQRESIFDSEHIELKLLIIDKVQQLVFRRTYIIYPEIPTISSKTSIRCLTSPRIYWNRRADFNQHFPIEKLESRADSICLNPEFAAVEAVEFVGRTDVTDEQVIRKSDLANSFNGNLLFCKDDEGDGLFILQEAPPSNERRDYETYDFRISGQHVYSCGWGIEPDEAGPDELWSYRHTIGLFSNDGTSGTANLKRYLKARFPVDINKNCTVMVNPWGCGQFPKLVNEQFLKDELKAAAKINATHYQIDDSWQKGQALSELAINNRLGDCEFWSINKDLLPNGFEPLIKQAEQVGIQAELWVAPSANQHYRDWHEFADILYEYHLKYGFSIFKIDFVQTRTKEAEDNLEKMLRYLREKSHGKIFFNLDTTNGQRPGYFMFLEYGNIFLENRYVCHNWGVGYHPEKTLNNLWNLANYMRPQSLQIEFTDPGIINYEFFQAKGMTFPDVYDPEYWAGIAMFANPLVWLAPSRLDPKFAEIFKQVISLHRKYAEEIFTGEIYSIGTEPDGSTFTGFQSHNDETGTGLFILYRELKAPEKAEIELKLLDVNTEYQIFRLSLEEEINIQSFVGNKFNLTLTRPGSWQLFRYIKNE